MNLMESTINKIIPLDADARAQARTRLEQLTMPHWALGRLMDLAEELAGMTGSVKPTVGRKTVVTMAGDHGIAAAGVSKYPQEVTVQMVYNFVRGGAGINALAKLVGAKVVVVDMGVAGDLGELVKSGKIISKRTGAGTRNMATGPAMSRNEAVRSLEGGIEVALELGSSTDIFGTGDMGIGNTSPSAAIIAIFSGSPLSEIVGRGTGIDDGQLVHKIAMIERALEMNRPDPGDA
ncbi:MAG: nicotinate-nucleotide--dimethylbenzimidazole phosphoribosyltransferase, partial [Syntrophales bacterium]